MERDDRAPVSTFFVDAAFAVNGTTTLGEQVAHHTRVKRLAVGDEVSLTNGIGSIARGKLDAINKSSVDVSVETVRTVPPPFALHLRAPVADRDRMLMLAEKATELGITSWQSVRFKRSMSVSPRGDGAAFIEKVRARMIAALEQSGGAWLPRILDEAPISSITFSNDELPIVLDVSGERLSSIAEAMTGRAPVVLVGPEGGIEPDEMSKLVDGGWRRIRLATNTLRFETAGIAIVAAIRSTHHGEEE